MAKCEVCLGVVEKTCGYEDQPMPHFCTEDYIEHLEGAHPTSKAAQAEARELRKQLRKSERELMQLLKDRYRTLPTQGSN